MSINQLAVIAEVESKTIQYQESGRTQIAYPKTAKKIVEALGVDLWDVYRCVDEHRQLVCREVELEIV